MEPIRASRPHLRLAALALATAVSLTAPAAAMEVTIDKVDSSVGTADGGGGSFLGPLVKIVTDTLKEQDAKRRRQQQDRPGQRPA